MEQMFIVVTGNVADGFSFFGPFAMAEQAGDWAEDNKLKPWDVVRLEEIGKS